MKNNATSAKNINPLKSGNLKYQNPAQTIDNKQLSQNNGLQ